MEPKDKSLPKKQRTIAAKIANVLAWILVSFLALFLLVFIFIQTPPGQNFIRGKRGEKVQEMKPISRQEHWQSLPQ